jgi:hypothetical protein
LLANLSISSISSIDQQLTDKGYTLILKDKEKGNYEYGFMNHNVFLIRMQLKSSLIDLHMRFIEEVFNNYKSQLDGLGLTLRNTIVTDEGIKYIYSSDEWYATLEKEIDKSGETDNSISILIGPLNP